MSTQFQWLEPATATTPPNSTQRLRRQKDWEPYDEFIDDLREKGVTVKDLQTALKRERGFVVGFDALKKRLTSRKPKYRPRTTTNETKIRFRVLKMESPTASLGPGSEGLPAQQDKEVVPSDVTEEIWGFIEATIEKMKRNTEESIDTDKAERIDVDWGAREKPDNDDDGANSREGEGGSEANGDEFAEELVRDDSPDDIVETVIARITFDIELDGDTAREGFLLEVFDLGVYDNANESITAAADSLVKKFQWHFDSVVVDRCWESSEPSTRRLCLEVEGYENTRPQSTSDGSRLIEDTSNGDDDDAVASFALKVVENLPVWWNSEKKDRCGVQPLEEKLLEFTVTLKGPWKEKYLGAIVGLLGSYRRSIEWSDLPHLREGLEVIRSLGSMAPSWIQGYAYGVVGTSLLEFWRYEEALFHLDTANQILLADTHSVTRFKDFVGFIWTKLIHCNYILGRFYAASQHAMRFFKAFENPYCEYQSRLRVKAVRLLLGSEWERTWNRFYVTATIRLIEQINRTIGHDSFEAYECKQYLADMYFVTDQHEKCLKLNAEAYQYSANTENVYLDLSTISNDLIALGRAGDAFRILSYLYPRCRKAQGDFGLLTLTTLYLAGVALGKLNDHANSLRFLKKALFTLKDSIGTRFERADVNGWVVVIQTEIFQTLVDRGLVLYAQPFAAAVDQGQLMICREHGDGPMRTTSGQEPL